MQRREVLQILTKACRETGALSIATMQATPVWHDIEPADPNHMDMLGCMGSASSMGLGLAIGSPQRPVVVIDGDGCLMMQLATLVTIGDAKAANLTVCVMNNKLYETSGNQPIPGAETADLVALAKAAGFANAVRIGSREALERQISGLIKGQGPTLAALDIDREEPAVNWPALSMKDQIQSLRRRALGEA